MSFATDGDSTEDLGTAFRRPISVAQLLEREGFRPASRTRATRRTLTGVAAGAVLTVGAVVGGLFLNHGQTSTRDTLAAAGVGQSGGDVVLTESDGGAIVAPVLPHQAGLATPISQAPRAAGHVTSGGGTARPAGRARVPAAPVVPAVHPQDNQPSAPTVQSAPAMAPAATPSTAPTDTSPNTTANASPNTSLNTSPNRPNTSPNSSTRTAPTTTPTDDSATTTPTTSTDPTTTPTTTPTQDHGGLLGGLVGALGLQHSGFDWFG